MTANTKTNRNSEAAKTAADKTRVFMISLFTALSLAVLIGLSFQAVPAAANQSATGGEMATEQVVAESNTEAATTIREGDHVNVDGVVVETPVKCEEGYTLVTLQNSDGEEFVMVADLESNYEMGDQIESYCEVAGFTTTSEGIRVPLIENGDF